MAAENNKSNYFFKFLNGEFGLKITFWIFFFLFNSIIYFFSKIFIDYSEPSYVFITAVLTYQLVSNFALWNAAVKYKGRKIYANTAKIFSFVNSAIGILIFIGVINFQNTIKNSSENKYPEDTENAFSPLVLSPKSQNSEIASKKLGKYWNWDQLPTKGENWWIIRADKDFQYVVDKFGIVSAFVKVESSKRRQLFGAEYDYSVLFFEFHCKEKKFRLNTITDVFQSEYMKDSEKFVGISFEPYSKNESIKVAGTEACFRGSKYVD